MPDFQTIYDQHADMYDRLVACEDYQGNILPALRRVRPLDGLEVLEMGAGTGRLTTLLAPEVRRILACDRSAHMLTMASHNLRRRGLTNVALVAADNARLPVADASADLALAGWSFGHSTEWHADSWQFVVGQALSEMRRVLRPAGTAIIIETLGSGSETPAPPSAILAEYYRWLEAQGWQSSWIRTDYRFTSRTQADELTGFFFGAAIPTIRNADGVVLPECTGIWWRSW